MGNQEMDYVPVYCLKQEKLVGGSAPSGAIAFYKCPHCGYVKGDLPAWHVFNPSAVLVERLLSTAKNSGAIKAWWTRVISGKRAMFAPLPE